MATEVDESLKPSEKPNPPPLAFQLWVRTKGSDAYGVFSPLSQRGPFTDMLPLIVDDDRLIVAGYHHRLEQWQMYQIDSRKTLGEPVSIRAVWRSSRLGPAWAVPRVPESGAAGRVNVMTPVPNSTASRMVSPILYQPKTARPCLLR